MKEPLSSYRAKRDFSRTGEPEGRIAGEGGNRFVVHKHHATADHYDLRLEHGGVLKSWAVPRGPSLDPGEKRLAVETEDHPVDYLDFEGVIPDGAYGAGPMIVWDTGVWAPMEDVETSLARGAFKFRLAGEKLKGGFMLARLKGKPGETKANWLFFKERDAGADPGTDILLTRPESVKSGRRIEELMPATPPTRPPEPSGPAAPRRALRPGALKGAIRVAMPSRIAPQLASPRADPPSGEDWLHEIKYDGYRTAAHIAGGTARLFTRKGLDWTGRYGALAAALGALDCREAVIDGEVVVLDETGLSRFAALQDVLSRKADGELAFFAFDLPFLNGWDLRAVPLARRKGLLATLLSGLPANGPVQYSDHVAGNVAAFFGRVSEMGLEGIISKRADAAYRSGRTTTWTKTKARRTGDFVIVGYTVSEAAGGLAALGVAERVADDLVWRGKVGTGFDAASLADLAARLEPLRDDGLALAGAPKGMRMVRPVLTAHVHYADLTRDGALRHAVYKGLREAALGAGGGTRAAPAPRRRLVTEADLAAISITNPTRRMFGRTGATKLDIAVYYAAIGDSMLPHLLGRPVSLVRCPSGKAADCFFQRHAFKGMPASVATIDIADSDGHPHGYIHLTDARGYLALAQFGVVEFHTWGSTVAAPDRPDRLVFDLDPGEGIAWGDIVSAAGAVRAALSAQGLVPFVKTSGGRGLHVVVPIRPEKDFKAAHAATRALAERIAKEHPGTFTVTMGPKNRKNRIFIDFHRNARSATSVAVYSLRARSHLPASAPLGWYDLASVDGPEDLNYSSLPGLIEISGDPWAEIDAAARDLPG
ncbi:MAG: DNA ligase D [Acuticoccus sp.]